MTLEHLERRCWQFIDLMQQGSQAIEREDALTLEAVSRASERLLEQIEIGWHLALTGPEGSAGENAWQRVRLLIKEALEQSAENQRKMSSWAQYHRQTLRTVRRAAETGADSREQRGFGNLHATA
jgi:hypothetical protein